MTLKNYPDTVCSLIKMLSAIDRLAMRASHSAVPHGKSRIRLMSSLVPLLLITASSCFAQDNGTASSALPSYLHRYDSIAPIPISKPMSPIGTIDRGIRPASATVNGINIESPRSYGISQFQATDDHEIARSSPLAHSQVILERSSARNIMHPLAENVNQAASSPSRSSNSLDDNHELPVHESRTETFGWIWHPGRANISANDSRNWPTLDSSPDSGYLSFPLNGSVFCGPFTNTVYSACTISRHIYAHSWTAGAGSEVHRHLNKRSPQHPTDFVR